jgi:hypothetical protein
LGQPVGPVGHRWRVALCIVTEPRSSYDRRIGPRSLVMVLVMICVHAFIQSCFEYACLMNAQRASRRELHLRFLPVAALALLLGLATAARGNEAIKPGQLPPTPRQAILGTVEQVFDTTSQIVGAAVERSLSLFGEPNAYIAGGELSGSFVVGGRHGVGQLQFADGAPMPVTWSALSIGIGLGADYGRVIMLVYGLDRPEDVFGIYGSVGGSAHFLAGANATILASDRARIVLISSGLGLRLSGDLSRIRIEPAVDTGAPRPPANICASPADCPQPGRR